MEKYALFVVMCEFMCKKKLIIWAFKRQHEFADQFFSCLILTLKTC
jgi:hypothetical protein